jgi:hypothetical protein
MSTTAIAFLVLVCLVGAVLLGRWLNAVLADHHWATGTQDTVKLALGLVATMSAVLLGLLVSAAKSSYDDQKHQVIEMAARVSVLDRLLEIYGDDAASARGELRAVIESAVARAWPQDGSPSDLGPERQSGGIFLQSIQRLVPQNSLQTEIRGQATSLALDLAQRRALLVANALDGAPAPLIAVVVVWLVVILFGFSLLAPRGPIALLALLVAAASVCGAIVLLLELYHPFDGPLRIPSTPITQALGPQPDK